MEQYLNLVKTVLENGGDSGNRTGVDTISCFALFYKVDLTKGFPLLTTKETKYKSMIHELLWYLSGEENIKDLKTKTKIWDDWADKDGLLETAYGRFWRRFPVPEPNHALSGEKWSYGKWTRRELNGQLVFDQIQYVIDTLKEIKQNPTTQNLRRMVVSAWHPANAAESKLPPCHYSFGFKVLGNKLNCHLTQRSGDIALGIPFNLACYSLLTQMIAQECGYESGEFAHTIIDAHIYKNHIEGLKEQITRKPRPLPTMTIAKKPMDKLTIDDFTLEGYNPHPPIKFKVAV